MLTRLCRAQMSNTKNLSKQFHMTSLKGDLFKFQSQLPKLPVPTLEETSQKYLRSIEPFLSPEQHQQSAQIVKEFVAGKGRELQSRLEAFAATKDNWLAEFWDDYAYMSYRDPVVPFVSYFFLHKDVRNAIGQSQLLKSTLLAYYTIEFMLTVQDETLEPEVIKGNPYCMNAFQYMFSNLRVPAPGSDVTVKYNGEEHLYFLVISNNNFYKVPHHVNGQPVTKAQLYSQFQHILNDSRKQPKGLGVGALTSLNRDEWLSTYESLLKSPVNKLSLDTVHAAAFVVCLDANTPVTIEEKSRNCWHGDGQNRFFDKPLEFFVGANGNSGFLGEHLRMDATPTVQLNNFVLLKIDREDPAALLSEVSSGNQIVLAEEASPRLLQWDINPVTRADIAAAIAKFNATIAAHDEEIVQYYGYGKNLIKQFKVSPDAYVQMMMQLAYYKYTGKIRPTYESAATRKYLKGRTETGRSVSIESKKFVETWSDVNATPDQKIAAFQAACKQHVAYLLEAADGKGVDRHLFGLKQMLQPGEEVPAIFQDPVFTYSQTWYISSSQVPSEHFQSWGWSQVIDDGFGCAYLINSEWLHVHISCKRGNGLQSKYLKYYIEETSNEMKTVLGATLKAKL